MYNRDKPNFVNIFLIKFLLPAVTLSINILLVIFVGFLIYQDFQVGVLEGARSFAASLIPLVLIAFINKQLSGRNIVESSSGSSIVRLFLHPATGFLLASIWGVGLMLIVAHFVARNSPPFAELVLSSTFIALVNYAGRERSRAEGYYAGMVFGFLIYIFIFGVPPSIINLS